MKFAIDGQQLVAGREFVAAAFSPSASGTFDVFHFLQDSASKTDVLAFTSKHDLSGKFLLIHNKVKDTVLKYLTEIPAGLMILRDKQLIWKVSDAFREGRFPVIYVHTDLDPAKIGRVSVNIDSKYKEDYQTQNVMAWVPGKKHPEKFIFLTAHYDHLGRMGKDVYFPGANDNASGTAMILDLARYFSQPGNQPDYSIGFIAFAAEEAGLLGSAYAAEHPPVDLENIEFLVNLDMVGTGSEGITIVNGKQLPDAFAVFQKINDDKGYLKEVKARGESCNSDHCMFYKKGVPAVFIYTRGKEFMEYHNQDDVAEALPLTRYEDLFKLLLDFVNTF
ncbi:MAG: M28 family peptidase [Bacteroidota bacterium]|nr:M28 family peptidase [Bacteroidota bacterium]